MHELTFCDVEQCSLYRIYACADTFSTIHWCSRRWYLFIEEYVWAEIEKNAYTFYKNEY